MKLSRQSIFPRLCRTFLVVLSVGAISCGGSTTTTSPTTTVAAEGNQMAVSATAVVTSGLPQIPTTPVAAPASLIVEAGLQNPNSQMTQLGILVDAIQPGMGAMASAQSLLQLLSGSLEIGTLKGVDLNAPLYILVLDGEKLVLMVSTSDKSELAKSLEGYPVKQMTHGSFSLIGRSDALTEVAPYAFSNLAKQRMPEKPTLNIYMSKFLSSKSGDRFRYSFKEGATRSSRQLGPYTDDILMELGKVDMISLMLDASTSGAKIAMNAKILPGAIKDFVATQSVSDFSMIKRVGTGPWAVSVLGNLNLNYFGPMLVKLAEKEKNPLLKLIATQFATLKGEFSFGMKGPNNPKRAEVPEAVFAMQLADSASVKSILSMLTLGMKNDKNLNMAGIKAEMKIQSLRTNGVKLHELKLKPTTADEIKLVGKKGVSGYFGVVGNFFVGAFGPDSKKTVKTLSIGKSAVANNGKELDAEISVAKENKESLLITLDPIFLRDLGVTKENKPVVIGIGFTDSMITGRLYFPIDTIKSIMY